MLFVRRQLIEGVGRTKFVLGERKIPESGLAAVRAPPVRQHQISFDDLDDFEGVFFIPPPPTPVIAAVFGTATFFDRNKRQMEIAVRLRGGGREHRGDGGIASLEGLER